MKSVVLGVFDIKLGSYIEKLILPHANQLVGLRFYGDNLRNTPVFAHPEDYRIDSLGVVDLDTGELEGSLVTSVLNVPDLWPKQPATE